MEAWKTQRTLLIVGEGYHEEAFLNHVKQLYAPRGCGLKVTIKNARGKSAQHVIEWTCRQIAIADYQQVAAMLDTDTVWTAKTVQLANKHKIKLLRSEPCFEALMLRLIKQPVVGDTQALKKQFAPFVNFDPTERSHYAKQYDQGCLDAGRKTEPTIDLLLGLFEIK